jgi:hypothetical protein
LSRRKLLYSLVVLSLVVAVPAFAKGGAPMSGTIAINSWSSPGAAPTASPALGNQMNFTTTWSNSVKNPRVQLACYQNGTQVYGEAGTPDHMFTLGGYASPWVTNGGTASCRADLYDLQWNGNNPQQVTWLANTTFDAAG